MRGGGLAAAVVLAQRVLYGTGKIPAIRGDDGDIAVVFSGGDLKGNFFFALFVGLRCINPTNKVGANARSGLNSPFSLTLPL